MSVTIYAPCFNEEILIAFFIHHYRERFPSCSFVFFDNFSTDSTEQIINQNEGCIIKKYDTGGKICDSRYIEIKNNAWKDASTDWVLVCDADELLDISETQLIEEEKNGVTAIKGQAWDMVNLNRENISLEEIKHGNRAPLYDKLCLFNKKFIAEINYGPGCHFAAPTGKVKTSPNTYLIYHMSNLSIFHKVQKYRTYNSRLSDENKRNGWGAHYSYDEKQIIDNYEQSMRTATKIK
jgi:glycosyltransferase involved in cell wall biosynthesis